MTNLDSIAEKQYERVLKNNYKKYNIEINGVSTGVYTNHLFDIVKNVDLSGIALSAGLTGDMKPLCLINYFITASDGSMEPVIAFIWSWSGPWAYIYNIKKPDKSNTDAVFLDQLELVA